MLRPVFQDGRILRTADFVREQAYHLDRHRRHNRSQHEWGIAWGLDVVLRDGELVVEPGHAVDGFGRDAVLEHVHPLDLRGFALRGIDIVDVWLLYDQVRRPATGDGVDWLSDGGQIEVDAATDVDPRKPPGVPSADLPFAPEREAPDDPARRWPIYLGRITTDLMDPTIPPTIDRTNRPYIGLVGSTVETADGQTWLELAADRASVSIKTNGTTRTPFVVDADDGITLDDRLTIEGDLVLHGGALTIGPPAVLGVPTTAPPDWSISHAADVVTHELRIALPNALAGGPPSRLVVGVWRDGEFAPCLVVEDTGTVVISGNLIVNGRIDAQQVQEAALTPEGFAYLAGTRPMSLLSLLAAHQAPGTP